jgi:hypothetical protein
VGNGWLAVYQVHGSNPGLDGRKITFFPLFRDLKLWNELDRQP